MVVHAYATAYPAEVDHLVLTEAMLPGIGLEAAMDITSGGSRHFGFHMPPADPGRRRRPDLLRHLVPGEPGPARATGRRRSVQHPEMSTAYGGDAHGYTDYPPLAA